MVTLVVLLGIVLVAKLCVGVFIAHDPMLCVNS